MTGRTTVVTVKGNLQVDSSTDFREAELLGLGIAVCPVWLFGDLLQSESLKLILKDYQPTPLPIHAVYLRGRFIPAKVRCFIEYFTNEFKDIRLGVKHLARRIARHPPQMSSAS